MQTGSDNNVIPSSALMRINRRWHDVPAYDEKDRKLMRHPAHQRVDCGGLWHAKEHRVHQRRRLFGRLRLVDGTLSC